MRGAKRVVLAFLAPRKARETVPHAQSLHALAASGQHLVTVGLVPHVPHDAVMRRVENVMQRDRELDGAEIGREMAARLAHRFKQERPQFIRELLQLPLVEPAQLVRIVDGLEQVVHRRPRC